MLGASGDVAARARALRAIGAEGCGLQRGTGWLSVASLGDMLRAVQPDRRRARRVGQALVGPDSLGLALCYSGLATPEKSYRRADQLLARESEAARYEPREIAGERGQILFHPPPPGDPQRLDAELGAQLCGVREGMLEAVPLLFGLLPARVSESQCAYRGAEHCVFELRWSRTLRRGLIAGAAAGLPLAAGAALLAVQAGLAPWAGALAALTVAVLAAGAGRSFDLARQLEAVAGSRRGQLALLDQLDASLAEKMDELAKAGAVPGPAAAGPAPSGEIHGLVPVAPVRGVEGGVTRGVTAGAEGEPREPVPLAALVERALAGLRPELPEGLDIQLDLAPGTPAVLCAEAQIEFVLQQLVRNAAEAAGPRGAVRVALRATPAGVEVAVEDDGDGMEQQTVDEVFDPFSGGRTAGSDTGFGLPVCYRIVEEHGGELQVQSAEGHGTRVSVLLPAAEIGSGSTSRRALR